MRHAPHPMTLRQLQYAVAVAEHGSFRRAAEECHVAQPSLSAQIAQLEDAVGVRLFERDHRKVAVSAAGEALIAHARALLAAADGWVDLGRTLADPMGGALRLGIIPTVAPYLLPDVAPVLRERFPRISFVWTEDKTPKLVESLDRGELDGALVAREADIGERAVFDIGRDAFVFAAPPGHPLVESAAPLVPRDLEGETVLLLDDGHCFRDQALSVCTQGGAEASDYRATSLQTLVQLAAGGAGVTLLPRMAVSVENRRDALRMRAFAPTSPARTLALVWRPGSPMEARLTAVAEVLKEAYGALNSAR